MKSYVKFITEANIAKLKHLEHITEAILFLGFDGARQSVEILRALRDSLAGQSNERVKTSIKFDGCVHANTLVETESGPIPIEDIVKNQHNIKVWTRNLQDNSNELVDIFNYSQTRPQKDWIEVSFENGKSVWVTEDHEIYVNEKGWVEAQNIMEGDDIAEM